MIYAYMYMMPKISPLGQALEDGRDFDPAELEELITLVEAPGDSVGARLGLGEGADFM